MALENGLCIQKVHQRLLPVNFALRVPPELHMRHRRIFIKTAESLNKLIIATMEAWVSEG